MVMALQAVSREIDLGRLIEALMVIAVEQAGAERGLLFLPHQHEHRIAAEATTHDDSVQVMPDQAFVTLPKFPESILRCVIRARKSVILDDASVQNLFSPDEYIRHRHSRSILCLPLLKLGELTGVLYLENNLTPGVFTPDRLAVLELLASQAAISLENARLYADLRQENSDRTKAEEALRASEERWRKLFENSSAGIGLCAPDGRFIAENFALQKMLGYTEEELQGLTPLQLTLDEDRAATEARIAESAEGQRQVHRIEKRYLRKDGSVIWTDVSTVFVPASGNTPAFFAAVIVDISDRKRAEEEIRRIRRLEGEIRQASRTETAETIRNVRALFQRDEVQMSSVDLRQILYDVERIVRADATSKNIALRLDLPTTLPTIIGNRTQLIEALMNLVLNAFDSVCECIDGPREVEMRASQPEARHIHVSVRDGGKGIEPEVMLRLFDAFFTTKPKGMGMGLAIVRSIIENHGGRLWATRNPDRGATFEFDLPVKADVKEAKLI